VAAGRLDLLADNAVMAGRYRRHGIAVGLPQLDAALDIGEQQRHQTIRKLHLPSVTPTPPASRSLSPVRMPKGLDCAINLSGVGFLDQNRFDSYRIATSRRLAASTRRKKSPLPFSSA
jgi:hypothetical protein